MQAGMRGAGFVVTAIGACASAAFTLYAGRHSPPVLVPAFVLWVLSPFLALVLMGMHEAHWSARSRTLLYSVMLLVAVASPAIYASRAFGPQRPQGAFVFVAIPAVSWIVAAAMYVVGWFTSRGR